MKGERPMKQFCPGIAALLAAAAVAALPHAASARGDGGRVVVSLSLSKYASVHSLDAGSAVGVRPDVVHVHVGDRVVFVNDDTDHHTATALVDAATFVDDPRWTDDALRASGEIGSGFW